MFALAFAATAAAAPELTEAQRQVLDDTATDGDRNLDEGPAMYTLLGNAAEWDADDFAGERGAATPPTPDYAYLAEHPGEVRGDLFLIEGRFVEQVRYPTADRDGRDTLIRAGNPQWGDQLTAWGIKVGDGEDDIVMVYFVDPGAAIQPPDNGDTVRVAARFYKVWTVPDRDGRPFDFLAFVGGGREVVTGGALTPGKGSSWNKLIIVLIIVAAGGFYGMRVFLARKAAAGQARSVKMREQRQRERGYAEDEDAGEADPELPEDPAEALAYLQSKDNPPAE